MVSQVKRPAALETQRLQAKSNLTRSKQLTAICSDWVGSILLMSISQDERERAVFRSRRMYQTDLQSDLATAEDRGRAEGREEGILAALQNLMDSMGLTIDHAMNALKIPEADRSRYRDLAGK